MLKKVFVQFFQGINRSGLVLILIGTLSWSLTMVKSGLEYSYGIGFWGPNGHDGVWHIALAEGLSRGSLQMPIFSGEAIKNYHIGFDLVLAFIHKITFIPISTLYFQLIPPLLAFLIGILTYKFTLKWTKSNLSAFWATFFVYFGGSWGWLVNYFNNQGFGGESMFWSQQSISTLINPPFALSLALILLGLVLLRNGLESKNNILLFLSAFVFGILVQIKVYAGILSVGALFISGIWEFVRKKETYIIKIFIIALILSVVFMLPYLASSRNLLEIKPFWYLETMMNFSDRVGWPRFGQAMVNYVLAKNWIKAIPAYLVAFIIFWFGNLGTRVIKEVLFIKHIKSFKKLDWLSVFFYTLIAGGIILPMIFVQKGTPWNTIQFFYYSLIYSGILAGVSLGDVLEVKKYQPKRLLLTVLIIVLTFPTTIIALSQYLPGRPPSKIPREELKALKFLAKEPNGVVLTLPFNKQAADAEVNKPPRPLYHYESTAYVSAFAKKPVFLEDEVNLEITGYDWKKRKAEVFDFLKTNDKEIAWEFLKRNKITYVYWIKKGIGKINPNQDVLEEIFDNNEVQVLRLR